MSIYTLLLLLPQARQVSTIVFVSRFLFVVFFLALSSTGIAFAADDDAVYMSKLLKALTPTPVGWSQNSTDFCQWNGVACGQNGRRVNAITLPSSSLNGEIPPGLNSLSELAHLDLHNNSLSGPFPSLANLTSLKTVYLGYNNFTSITDDCFRGLTALQTLNLSFNTGNLAWSFPTNLSQSSSLRTLELAAMTMFGELPAGIFDWFPSLQSIDLSSNYFDGSLPVCLGRFRSRIRHLRLNDNQFTGPIPDLSNCTDLSDLQLSHNYLTGFVPPSLMALPSLQNVSLDNNYLQGPITVLFRENVKATWEMNRFCRADAGPCDPQVTTLLEIAAAFGYPPRLSYTWKGNEICGNSSSSWAYIECKGGKISSIDIGNLNFGGTISPAFANLTSLWKLTLSDNNLTGTIPHSLTSLPQLEFLDLSNNNLFGQVPNFSSKVTLFTNGNVNLVGPSRGAGVPSLVSGHPASGGSSKTSNATSLRPLWIAGVLVLSAAVMILILIIGKRKRYFSLIQKNISNKKRKNIDHNVEAFLQIHTLSMPKRYSYAEVKKITNSFRDKLGQGGYGVVYKASLPDGRHVAVKVISPREMVKNS